jgi:hypothetical protein
MHPLTGDPAVIKMHKNISQNALWEMIIHAEEKDYIMCTAVAS